MREVWFTAACIFSFAAMVSDAENIRYAAIVVALLFWVAFIIAERYCRLNTVQPQSEKDA